MEDEALIDRIDTLAQEEHKLFALESDGVATVNDRARLEQLQIMLDQCWDLLRQRRAKREFGLDPEEAHMRDTETIKNYVA